MWMHILVYNIVFQLSSEYTIQKYCGNSLYRSYGYIVPLALSYSAQLRVYHEDPRHRANRITWSSPDLHISPWYVRCHFVQVWSDLKAKNNPRHIHIQTSAFATYVCRGHDKRKLSTCALFNGSSANWHYIMQVERVHWHDENDINPVMQ